MSKNMTKNKYQNELRKLKAEEKHMRLIAAHLEDQINRLKVEELALKSQLSIQENPSILKEPQPKKSEDVDVNINAVPLNLGVSYLHNNDDEEDEEEEDENTAEVSQLSNFLDQLARQQQQQEEEEEEDEEDDL